MPHDSIYVENPKDKIADAKEVPLYGNWAGSIVKQYSRLGMALLFLPSCVSGLNSLDFQVNPRRASSASFRRGCICPQEQLSLNGPSSARILHGAYASVI